MKKTAILWILAVVITLTAAIYQRMTGPTYPKHVSFEINGQPYETKLMRSQETIEDCKMEIEIPDTSVSGTAFYRRFPTNEKFFEEQMIRRGNNLVFTLPKQPSAGKLEYYLQFQSKGNVIPLAQEQHVVIRYKDPVPTFVLAPHIFMMFFAMLLSNLAGLMALAGHPKYKFWGMTAFVLLCIGGGILGPIVQKFAFGEYWTGIPWGWDLTDNKTLIAILGWVVAVVLNLKKERPMWIVFAAVLLLLIYSIPHSLFGSQLNVHTGTIQQGFIQLVHFIK